MRNKLLTCVAMLLCIAVCEAQDAPSNPQPAADRNIPAVNKATLKRIGTIVQSLGDAHGQSIEDVIVEAFKPPKDDNHKWHFTLLLESKPGTKELTPASAAAKRDAETSEYFAPWINVIDKEKSVVHYNWRDVVKDADLHRDFMQHIKEDVKQLPAIVIQPPKHGLYGPDSNIVGILPIPNYTSADAQSVIEAAQQTIVNYLTAEFNAGRIKEFPMEVDSHGQAQPPPGLEMLQVPSSGRRYNGKTIPEGAARPKKLSMDDIEVLVPDAPREFLQYCYREQLTKDEIIAEWNNRPQTPVVAPPNANVNHVVNSDDESFTDPDGRTLILLEVLALIQLVVGAVGLYMFIRFKRDMEAKRILTQIEVEQLTAIVKRFDQANKTA